MAQVTDSGLSRRGAMALAAALAATAVTAIATVGGLRHLQVPSAHQPAPVVVVHAAPAPPPAALQEVSD